MRPPCKQCGDESMPARRFCRACHNRLNAERESKKYRSNPEYRTRLLRAAKEFRLANIEKVRAKERLKRRSPAQRRDEYLRRRYGLSLVAFDALLESQGGRCAICGIGKQSSGWHVDHDHSSGAVRGIVHSRCNVFAGYVEKNPGLIGRVFDYLGARAPQKEM